MSNVADHVYIVQITTTATSQPLRALLAGDDILDQNLSSVVLHPDQATVVRNNADADVHELSISSAFEVPARNAFDEIFVKNVGTCVLEIYYDD